MENLVERTMVDGLWVACKPVIQATMRGQVDRRSPVRVWWCAHPRTEVLRQDVERSQPRQQRGDAHAHRAEPLSARRVRRRTIARPARGVSPPHRRVAGAAAALGHGSLGNRPDRQGAQVHPHGLVDPPSVQAESQRRRTHQAHRHEDDDAVRIGRVDMRGLTES